MSLVTSLKASCQFGMKQYRFTLTSYNTFCRATPRSEQGGGGSTAVGQIVWGSPYTLFQFMVRTIVWMGERTYGLFVPAHYHHHQPKASIGLYYDFNASSFYWLVKTRKVLWVCM